MIAQYVAASLVSENKVLVHPASVDSIPTSAGQEDHVSMGATAAVHLWHVCANVERVLGDRAPVRRPGPRLPRAASGRGRPSQPPMRRVRELSPHLAEDRSLAAEIEGLAARLRDGSLLASVEQGRAPLL